MSITAQLPAHIPACMPPADSETSAPARAARTKRGITDTSKRWPDGVITVSLDLRDQKSKALVVDAIREWAHHTPGLRFRIVEGKEGDIRISDDEGLKGNWSQLGTDAKDIPLNEPTMHLERNDNSKEFRRVVLHEFGHALGLEHEHQHPEHDVNWNKDVVYRHFVEVEGWDEEDIEANLFKIPTGSDLLTTSYDRESVMHYAIDPRATQDGRGVPTRYSLSEGDKAIIRKLYTPGRFQAKDPDPA